MKGLQMKSFQRKGIKLNCLTKKLIIIFLLISMIMTGCGKKEDGGTKLLVAAAASLKNVMGEIQTRYNQINPEVKVNYTFAGSGALVQQIQQGAPADVFISAAENEMDTLAKDKLIIDNTRVDLLGNRVVLIVPKDSKLDIKSFNDILKAHIIALGNPDSVPVGEYAKEIFTGLNIYDQVKEKATFGKDVTEVLAWVGSGNADAGVVYATDAASGDKVKIASEAPESSYSKVIYPAAVVKDTAEEKQAQSFLDFLQTKAAKDIFKKYGFQPIG